MPIWGNTDVLGQNDRGKVNRSRPTHYDIGSGVVGRERMGTAFPHKKLSGNGVPTREILRDIFFIIAIKLAIFHGYHVTAFRASQTM